MPEKKTGKVDKILAVLDTLKKEIAKVMIGQEDVVEKALIVIFSGQHALVEGVPGLAKTLLIRTLGRVLSGDTQRIQFTPDLMPADITGTQVFNLQTNKFYLVKGPIFTTFLLADEINRAPAKTQSALLQAMQERSVSIDRTTHILDPHFTVFATQNPIEHKAAAQDGVHHSRERQSATCQGQKPPDPRVQGGQNGGRKQESYKPEQAFMWNDQRGTLTSLRTLSMTSSEVNPSNSNSGLKMSLWTRTGSAMALMSSGVTKFLPRIAAKPRLAKSRD